MNPNLKTSNDFFVSIHQNRVIFLAPIPGVISREQALNLAAYLVVLADHNDEFNELLEKVTNT